MTPTNKYYQTLADILENGRTQTNKKGNIKYLTNQVLHLTPADLLDIFETHGIARKKLKTELQMFQAGITATEQYRAEGITWWDYCGDRLINSYPTYFRKFPALVEKNQNGDAREQKLCAVSRRNRRTDEPTAVPLIGAVPDRGRLTHRVRLPTQQRCQSGIAC